MKNDAIYLLSDLVSFANFANVVSIMEELLLNDIWFVQSVNGFISVPPYHHIKVYLM